jgi:hypothetical protein
MNLAHLFIDTITYSTGWTFSDGNMTASGTSTAKCRWEETYKVVTTSGGEERASSHRLSTATAIELNAFVWPPGVSSANQGDALRVLTRKYARTLDGGYNYYILELGR